MCLDYIGFMLINTIILNRVFFFSKFQIPQSRIVDFNLIQMSCSGTVTFDFLISSITAILDNDI